MMSQQTGGVELNYIFFFTSQVLYRPSSKMMENEGLRVFCGRACLEQASAAAILKQSLFLYLFSMFVASIKSPALWKCNNKFLEYLFKAMLFWFVEHRH